MRRAEVNIPLKILACPMDELFDEINSTWTVASEDNPSSVENVSESLEER